MSTWESITTGWTLDGVKDMFSVFRDFFETAQETLITALDAVEMFNTELVVRREYVADLRTQIDAGGTAPIDLVEILANYRYLVGDSIYYLTFMLIIAGLLFSIYKLIWYIIEVGTPGINVSG